MQSKIIGNTFDVGVLSIFVILSFTRRASRKPLVQNAIQMNENKKMSTDWFGGFPVEFILNIIYIFGLTVLNSFYSGYSLVSLKNISF